MEMLQMIHSSYKNTGLFISPSGISEFDRATTKTGTKGAHIEHL